MSSILRVVATAVAGTVVLTSCSAVVESTARPAYSSSLSTTSPTPTANSTEKRWNGAVVAMETSNSGVRTATCSFLDGGLGFTDAELVGLKEELRRVMTPGLEADPRMTGYDRRSGDPKVHGGKLNFYCNITPLPTSTS